MAAKVLKALEATSIESIFSDWKKRKEGKPGFGDFSQCFELLSAYDAGELRQLLQKTEEDFVKMLCLPTGRADVHILASLLYADLHKELGAALLEPLQRFSNAVRDKQLIKDGMFLSFLDSTLQFPFVGFNKLFVRHFYDAFIDDVLRCFDPTRPTTKAWRNSVVTGNPGIGKSAFGVYLLQRAIAVGRPVVYQRDNGDCFVFKNGVVGFARANHLDLIKLELKVDPTILYIADSIAPIRTGGTEGTTIVITSPRNDRFKAFRKYTGAPVYTFPVHSREEMTLSHQHCFLSVVSDKNFEERLKVWGGIPRRVFADNAADKLDPDGKKEISAAVIATQAMDMSCESRRTPLECGADVSHLIFHLLTEGSLGKVTSPSDPLYYSFVARVPATEYVAWVLANEWASTQLLGLANFIHGARSSTELATLKGYSMELYALSLLQSGGNFQTRPLDPSLSPTTTAKAKETPGINLPPATAVEFKSLSELQTLFAANKNGFYRPKSKTVCAVDYILPGGRMVQVTISETRGIKLGPEPTPKPTIVTPGLEAVAAALGFNTDSDNNNNNDDDSTIPVYIAVPQSMYPTYPLQELQRGRKVVNPSEDAFGQRVRQYALCIPVLSVIFQSSVAIGQTRSFSTSTRQRAVAQLVRAFRFLV